VQLGWDWKRGKDAVIADAYLLRITEIVTSKNIVISPLAGK
jgi:hypothetical protein